MWRIKIRRSEMSAKLLYKRLQNSVLKRFQKPCTEAAKLRSISKNVGNIASTKSPSR
jgi:hypothetical protein